MTNHPFTTKEVRALKKCKYFGASYYLSRKGDP